MIRAENRCEGERQQNDRKGGGMSYLVCFGMTKSHCEHPTFVSLLAWPDPNRDCDLRRVSTTIGVRDRLGLGYELYIAPVVGVGDADFHHHRGGRHATYSGPGSSRWTLEDLAQLSGIALIGFFFLQLTESPNKFV